MRSNFLLVLALAAFTVSPTLAQSRRSQRPPAAPAASSADDYHFTPALHAGQRLDVGNIDGDVKVVQGGNSQADITVRKNVRRGDGSLVKAVLEVTSDGYRVCTVYLNRDRSNGTCGGHDVGDHGSNSWREPLDVEMQYDIRLPAGVALVVHSVDGNVEARGLDTPANITTVDGNITFDGTAPESITTVDGNITGTITSRALDHDIAIRSVDGAITLSLPESAALTLDGSTVDGDIQSDFPVTMSGKVGPHSFHGTIGSNGSRTLKLKTVDGSIHLHRTGRE